MDPIENLVRTLLTEVNENPDREGLAKTPERFAKAFRTFTSGYDQDPIKVAKGALFGSESSEIVLIKDIELYSLCEHHLIPFFGKAHVAYIPNGKIVGLSKVPRVVDIYSRRLQVQERLTSQIADCLMDALDPLGVAVVIDAVHLCMMMRGVGKQNSRTVTSAMRGEFRHQSDTRKELMHLLGGLHR